MRTRSVLHSYVTVDPVVWDAESDADQPTAENDDVALSRSFLVEASAPVTKETRVSDGLVETKETEVSITRRVDTLGAFDAFYERRNKSSWRTNVIEILLSEEAPESVAYEFRPAEWDVVVDGRVDAFRGMIEALAGPELETGGDTHMRDADYSQDLIELHRSLTESETLDEDGAFARLVDDCWKARLFGSRSS